MTSPTIEQAIDVEWKRLGSPGTWWNAEERISIARQTRLARDGMAADACMLSDIAVEAVRRIADGAHTIDKTWIDSCHERGLDPLPMVELLAVVSKVVAIDTYLEGMGTEPRPLPDATPGEPSREGVEGARIDHGWLPTKGRAGAPVCFSAVAAEHQGWHEIHRAFYLDIEEMRDLDIHKGLHRSQMELLAARTSHYNDCFY